MARSEQLRLTLNGRYVYGDQDNELTARNARGTIKMDFFVTKRLFWFASAYFEQRSRSKISNYELPYPPVQAINSSKKAIMLVPGSKT